MDPYLMWKFKQFCFKIRLYGDCRHLDLVNTVSLLSAPELIYHALNRGAVFNKVLSRFH